MPCVCARLCPEIQERTGSLHSLTKPIKIDGRVRSAALSARRAYRRRLGGTPGDDGSPQGCGGASRRAGLQRIPRQGEEMLGISLDSRRAILICLVTMTASQSLVTRAWGQATVTESHDKETGLQEITVTATRRETKLSDTPISMSVVTADQIENQRVVNFADIELAIPNLVFTQVTRQETVFSIRGTGVDNDTPGADAGVSVFIDGVPKTGVHDTTPELFDLQSVEVLRGPQGTLFGRNTTGGAVIMRTIAPSFKPTFKGQLTYGNDNLADLNGLVTGPLIENSLAGKFSFLLHRRDGYVDNVGQNREEGREKSGAMRGQLLWVPADDVKVTLGGEYFRDTSQSRVGGL